MVRLTVWVGERGRRQETEDRRQKTEDRRQETAQEGTEFRFLMLEFDSEK
jgi:hypothetical protein